ncbi:MAG TPA: hypothetical protein VGW31_03435 [Hanamia sp.]|nr:hypothetical protein [Hanamia sp.]
MNLNRQVIRRHSQFMVLLVAAMPQTIGTNTNNGWIPEESLQ